MGLVYIKHDTVEGLGGPVPEENLEFWQAKGWEPASAEEAEAWEAAKDDVAQPPSAVPTTEEDLNSKTKDELVELAALREIEIPSGAKKAEIVSALTEGS